MASLLNHLISNTEFKGGSEMSRNIARKATTGLLTLVLTTGAGIGLATSASAAPATGGTVATKSMSTSLVVSSPDGFANVRSGPGVNNKIVGRLKNGAKVTVLETKGGWSRIGKCEWVASWLLTSKTSGCKDKCATPPKDPCKDRGKGKCPAPAPKQICRVLIGPKCPTEAQARSLAAKIGGGAFVVNNGDGTWSVQVGAFSIRANAEARAAQFRNARVVCTNLKR